MNSVETITTLRQRGGDSLERPRHGALRAVVVGAGLAGAACARALADRGVQVTVIEKSRGPGGRLATRRVDRTDAALPPFALDHGAPGLQARDATLVGWLATGEAEGWARRWRPRRAGPSAPTAPDEVWVGTPGMPDLVRPLLRDIPLRVGDRVERLLRRPDGWLPVGQGVALSEPADHLLLAVPAPQAIELLGDWRPGWTDGLRQRPMQPCWTLLGETDAVATDWDAWHDERGPGPIAQALRQDRRPGRTPAPGRTPWAVHATVDWSRAQLEAPATDVEAALAAALEALIGQPLQWRWRQVHRWRYARVDRRRPAAAAAGPVGRADAWHDGGQGLGLCGDAIAGGDAEAAWRSGRALAAMVLAAEASRAASGARPQEARS